MRNGFGQLTRPAVSGVDLARLTGNVAELAASCQAWGTALANLHTMSTRRSATPLAPRPAVLNPRHLMPSLRDVARGSGYVTVLEAYESSPDLRAAATEVDDRWTEQHWIHGNVSASTVIVEHWPALRVSFIDLEDAGLGDPAWDLASAVDTIDLLAPRWRVMPQLLLDYLLLGYCRAGGPARLYPAMQAVRALTTALQAGSEDESNWPKGERADVTVLLERARGYGRACRMPESRRLEVLRPAPWCQEGEPEGASNRSTLIARDVFPHTVANVGSFRPFRLHS